MSEEEKNEETQATEETQVTQETQGTQTTLEVALAERDTRIADLEKALSEAKSRLGRDEAVAAELTQLREAHGKAVARYLDAARALNSTIPHDVISGQTIEEIDASVQKAAAIAESVRASLESQAKGARVPAGAPARGSISLEGLSPREKIAAGIQQGSQR